MMLKKCLKIMKRHFLMGERLFSPSVWSWHLADFSIQMQQRNPHCQIANCFSKCEGKHKIVGNTQISYVFLVNFCTVSARRKKTPEFPRFHEAKLVQQMNGGFKVCIDLFERVCRSFWPSFFCFVFLFLRFPSISFSTFSESKSRQNR